MSKVFDSTDYGTTIKASELDAQGIDCVPIDLERCKSDLYKNDFFRLTAEVDGAIEVIQFGNQKLGKLFTENWDELEGRHINLARIGEGYSAKYVVRLKE